MRRAAIFFALLLGACHTSTPVANDDAGPGTTVAADWYPVLDGLDQTLLSIWGTSSKDVWTVGGPLGNDGFDSLVIRFDGTTWKKQAVTGTETFWWVHGSGPNDVWLVGEKGRITHWDGAKFSEIPSGTTATLFGVWAAAPNDAWAVGGAPESPDQPNDVLLHWDGTTWSPEPLPETKKIAFFKVWGSSADDVYVVGEAGTVWHRTGGAWKAEAAGLGTGRLTTVTGCSDHRVFAVGGRDVLESDGQTWSRATIDPLDLVNDVNGVACAPVGATPRPWGDVVIVGGGSLKLRLADGTWTSDFGSKPFTDLHGAWIDETGALWGVGGNFNATPVAHASRGGVVARYSDDLAPSTLSP